jgi:hypothetical protein
MSIILIENIKLVGAQLKKYYLCINNFRHASLQCVLGRNFFYTPMVTYAKQPLSIADQMEILKSRGILFDNEQAAIEYLK